jgi:hypothetical protein
MPIMNQYTVTIALSDPFQRSHDTSQLPLDSFGEVNIRVFESIENLQKTFTLTAEGRPDYTLSNEESACLLELVSQISASAPWKGQMGFDGMVSTLSLQGLMSQMTYSWWGDVPVEWQSVGAVFNYVMAIYGR